MSSPLQYLLPRRQGPGLCATGLVSYLVTLQNELVNAVHRHSGEEPRYKTYLILYFRATLKTKFTESKNRRNSKGLLIKNKFYLFSVALFFFWTKNMKQNILIYVLFIKHSYKVAIADLMDEHVISYDVEKDLLPLVLSNCQYSLGRGQETISEYDLPRIQQQILTRFLQEKPLITRTVSQQSLITVTQ